MIEEIKAQDLDTNKFITGKVSEIVAAVARSNGSRFTFSIPDQIPDI